MKTLILAGSALLARGALAQGAPAQAKPLTPIDQSSFLREESSIDASRGYQTLREIYRMMNVFRRHHAGNYPTPNNRLLDHVTSNLELYGFDGENQMWSALSDPNNIMNDYLFMRGNWQRRVPFHVNVRPDGAPIGSSKPQGTRDVLASVNTYVYQTTVSPPTSALPSMRTINSVGFHLVLYEDGEIAPIAFDRVFYAFQDENSYVYGFPGQAGLPFNSLSYEEAQRREDEVMLRRPAPTFPAIGRRIGVGDERTNQANFALAEIVVALSRRMNREKLRGEVWRLFDALGAEPYDFADLPRIMRELGLDARLERLSLRQVERRGGSVALLLPKYGQPVVIMALDRDHAVVLDRARTFVMPRQRLADALGGEDSLSEMLVPEADQTEVAAIRAQGGVREVALPSREAVVAQRVTLRNSGQNPVTLRLEYPLLGVTQARLGRHELAPGQETELELSLAWRPALATPTQTVLVSLATSDPLVPRLQLAFVLSPPGPEPALPRLINNSG